MQQLRRDKIVIDYCQKCRHLWLDAGEARSIERFFTGPQAIPLLRLPSTTMFVAPSSTSATGGEVLEVGDLIGGIVEIIGALLDLLGDLG